MTRIGPEAFYRCTSLLQISLPASLSGIDYRTFGDCTSLTDVSIATGVTSIGDSAFHGCTNLIAVSIPDSITRIGYSAFDNCPSLASVHIPGSVKTIGEGAFGGCSSLTEIEVNPLNPFFSSVSGVLFDKSQTTLLEYPAGKPGSYTIPDGVRRIGSGAFRQCTGLRSVTIPDGVIQLPDYAFADCTNLKEIYFRGNSPIMGPSVFSGDNNLKFFYLPGTTGWGPPFGQLHLLPWMLPNPVILHSNHDFGVQANGFGFTISWATNVLVVVEAAADLVNPLWLPVSTNTLVGGTSYFSDPDWANHPARLYRLRAP